MNAPETLKDKLKLIISSVGVLPSVLITMMSGKLAQELVADSKSGKMPNIPDEVWDYFKTLEPEIQNFIIASFCHGLVTSYNVDPNSIPTTEKKIVNTPIFKSRNDQPPPYFAG